MNKTDKFKNFLYYEWRKLVLIALVLVLCAVTFVQCRSRVETDLGIIFISNTMPGELELLGENVKNADIAKDADGDGVTSVVTRTVLIPNDEKFAMQQQVPEQIQIAFVSGECRLFLVNEDVLKAHSANSNFLNLTDTAESLGIDKDRYRLHADGGIYGISVSGNKLLEGLGINTENLYIAQRNYLSKDKDDVLNINAGEALEYILKNH